MNNREKSSETVGTPSLTSSSPCHSGMRVSAPLTRLWKKDSGKEGIGQTRVRVCVTKYLAGKKSFSPKESRGDAGITSLFFSPADSPNSPSAEPPKKSFPQKRQSECGGRNCAGAFETTRGGMDGVERSCDEDMKINLMFFRQNPSVRPTEPPHCSIRARNLISSLGSVRLRLPSPIFIDFQTFAILPSSSSDDDSYQFDIYHRPPFFSARFFPALPLSSHSIESKYAYRDLLRPPRSHPRLQSDLSHGTESDQIILQDTDARSLSDVKMENAFETYRGLLYSAQTQLRRTQAGPGRPV